MMPRNFGPCMCGAIDCPSCGPAQGYAVARVWNFKRSCWEWVNPEEEEEDVEAPEPDDCDGASSPGD